MIFNELFHCTFSLICIVPILIAVVVVDTLKNVYKLICLVFAIPKVSGGGEFDDQNKNHLKNREAKESKQRLLKDHSSVY